MNFSSAAVQGNQTSQQIDISTDDFNTVDLSLPKLRLQNYNCPKGDSLIQTAEVKNFELQSGTILETARIGFTVYSTNLGPDESPADRPIVVVHPALTGTACAKVDHPKPGAQGDGWWSQCIGSGINPLTGEEYLLNTDKVTVICFDHFAGRSVGADEYYQSSTSAAELGSIAEEVVLADGVNLSARVLKENFGIESVRAVFGGSMGGGQAFEWLFQNTLPVEQIYDISGCGVLNPSARSFFGMQAKFLREDEDIADDIERLASDLQKSLPDARLTSGFQEAVDHVVKGFADYKNGIWFDAENQEASKLFLVRQLGFLLFVPPEFFEVKSQQGSVPVWLDKQGERFANRFDAAGLASVCSMIAKSSDLEPCDVVERLQQLNSTKLIRTANFGDTLFPAEQQIDFNGDVNRSLEKSNQSHLFSQYTSEDYLRGHDRFLSKAFAQHDTFVLREELYSS